MKKLTLPFLLSITFLFAAQGNSQMRMIHNFKDTLELSNYIDSLYRSDSFSGIVAIAKGYHLIYSHAAGFANKEKRMPISANSIFNMASITKMFTGVAVMQLVEQNKLSLNDPVSRYLPDFPGKAWANQATIEDLLTHTSGIGDFIPYEHKFNNAFNLKEIIDTIGKVVTVQPPSKQMAYSNAGFYLLGRIIEIVSGKNYFDYVRKNIFEIAGMTGTFFTAQKGDDRIAKGYMPGESSGQYETNDKIINGTGGPAGGAYTTIADLLAFQKALENNLLLKEKSFKAMTTLAAQGERGMGYGLGIGVGTMPNGAVWIGHNGGGPGIAANFAWFIHNNYSVIVFINQDAKSNMSLLFRSQLFVSELK